jgi:predicted dehydrogenase
MRKLRWGILATGGIANQFCADLSQSVDSEIMAVTSRDLSKAQAFAAHFNIANFYDDYQEMLADQKVDIVYVATPHVFHFANTIEALKAGKHVVCEKPIAMNPEQVRECVDVAKAHNCFLLEAVWMAFFPTIIQAKQWLTSGAIGTAQSFEANFDFAAPYDPKSRLYDLSLGGGALMDIGLYPLFLSTYLFGEAHIQSASAIKSESGADILDYISAHHKNGVESKHRFSFLHDRPCEAFIYGEKGFIHLHDRFFCGQEVTLGSYQGETQTSRFEFQGNGYQFEICAVELAIQNGDLECVQYSHQLMLENHALLHHARQAIGIEYEQ